ncbi:MAG TPA: helix-turn-helix domain-containing protein [Sphingomonadaceae bacterium]|nr:helix-turn-helix domain-containing protein [Sphingomonadaceae bacterium]
MLHSIKDTCRLLRIGKTFVYRLIGEGKLDKVKIGRRSLVTDASIRQLIDTNRQLREECDF